MQIKTSFFLLLLGNVCLYLDAAFAFVLAVTMDCLLVLLLNIPVVVILYSLGRLLAKRLYI
ncbi:hypothetical protein C0J08_01625 [Marinomonas sp. CT5]|uniref:hypothetical protein n=1 Tax=Marinomonas sp. CT5 TaxID=2066133 RepID=UPI0017E515E8|nr:hypothetical protein [Marinomonas sp. CT5]NVK72003.1 hypothetical protein [Oceanospirillaceae bacterium]QUX94179.1 hypothetical protein C0J08_01625 [Marinomonas sp. CT5]